jgi:DNA replication protein DnaC
MSKIEETLRKITASTSKENSPSSSSIDHGIGEKSQELPGDPNCPICGGIGFVRYDVPVGHSNFGKVEICACRQGQVSRRVRQRLFEISNLGQLSHLTFDNFLPRGRVGLVPSQADSLERAFNQSQQYARKLEGWLLLQGGYGCGKTHLAAAIGNFAVSLGVPTLFVTVPDLLDLMRQSYSDKETGFEERFDEIRRASLLILDDFGTQNATPWAQEKLFQILNYRYINRLALVVTTNLSLRQIEGRILSRLQDPDLVTSVYITAGDFRNPLGDTGQPELLSVLHNRTFASFDLRKVEGLDREEAQSLERAFRAAKDFAEHPRGWLVFMGSYGVGKTHLAAAIANYQFDQGKPPMFVQVPDLLDHLRATFSPSSSVSYDLRFDEIRTAPLLILDDLGTQSMTPWVREKLYQLFNSRYFSELPTVITTSDRLEDMDKRLVSRFKDARVCDIYLITVPGYAYHGIQKRKRQAGPRKRVGY